MFHVAKSPLRKPHRGLSCNLLPTFRALPHIFTH
jgi:hypothetical protein